MLDTDTGSGTSVLGSRMVGGLYKSVAGKV